jgi:hypothetical protein
MPKKRKPSVEEIAALTNELRTLWRRGEALRPWLRKHRQMILDLVHDDWSWAAIAKVFSKAGIKYRAGKGQDWHAEGLRREFVRAAIPLKRDKNPEDLIDREQKTRINTMLGETGRSTRNMNDSPPIVTPNTRDRIGAADVHGFTVAPVFKAFSLKAQEAPLQISATESEERNALRRRMFGK